MAIKLNKYLTRLQMFFVKGSTSKRSWLSLQSFFDYINETIKCEDDIYKSYQSAVSSQSKAVPPPLPGGGLLCVKL